jgi:hypothetical protein
VPGSHKAEGFRDIVEDVVGDKDAAGGIPAGPGHEVLDGRKLQGDGVGTAELSGCESSETCGKIATKLVRIEE